MSIREMPNGIFTVQFQCKDADGNDVHKFRRGSASKTEAEARKSDYKATRGKSMSMKFADFPLIYENDLSSRLRESTWATKKSHGKNQDQAILRQYEDGGHLEHRHRTLAKQTREQEGTQRRALLPNLPAHY